MFPLRRAVLLVVVLVVAGCGGGGSHRFEGSATSDVVDEYDQRVNDGEGCFDSAVFSDGDEVLIKDGSGKLIATSRVSEGTVIESRFERDPSADLDTRHSRYRCQYTFTVEKLPKADFYAISVGDSKPLNLSYDDLKSQDWKLTID